MLLCLDYGDRYIGIAATDTEGRIPYRYGTIDQKMQNALHEIQQIVEKERIVRVLVGVPLSLEGNETQQTHKTLAFVEALRAEVGPMAEIETIDETLTSVEAARLLQYEGGKKEDEHAEAARLMLQDHLRQLSV